MILSKKISVIKMAAVLAAAFCAFFALPKNSLAASVEMQKDVAVTDTFDLGPTSFSIDVYPGQSVTRVLQATNRKGHEQIFLVEVEDFEGSYDPKNVINLKGKEAGRFSAKDWIKPELWEFTTQHGERQFFEVKIDVPASADVGDHYAAVLVSAPASEGVEDKKESTAPAVKVRSRVGTLLFINVIGQTTEDGELENFSASRQWYEKSPIELNLVFKNKGTIRLQPQGKIEINDQFGKTVGTLNVEQFNVLRDSSRRMQYQWNRKNLAGRYTAKLTLDRGYGGIVDERTVVFWVLPWKLALAVFGAILLLITLLILAKKYLKFELKVARKKNEKEIRNGNKAGDFHHFQNSHFDSKFRLQNRNQNNIDRDQKPVKISEKRKGVIDLRNK